jgi:hypothetical protein
MAVLVIRLPTKSMDNCEELPDTGDIYMTAKLPNENQSEFVNFFSLRQVWQFGFFLWRPPARRLPDYVTNVFHSEFKTLPL